MEQTESVRKRERIFLLHLFAESDILIDRKQFELSFCPIYSIAIFASASFYTHRDALSSAACPLLERWKIYIKSDKMRIRCGISHTAYLTPMNKESSAHYNLWAPNNTLGRPRWCTHKQICCTFWLEMRNISRRYIFTDIFLTNRSPAMDFTFADGIQTW